MSRALSWLVVLALVATLAAFGGTEARGQGGGNRLVNSGAESGATDGWEATGFRAARYGESAQVPPADPSRPLLGHWLFQATAPDATMRQVASFGDLAAGIDSGSKQLQVGGLLGGAAGSPEGIRMTAQPLDVAGGQLGAPIIVGPPMAADRKGATALASCSRAFHAPVGMRAIEITLAPANVVGETTATADLLFASEVIGSRPASLGYASQATGPSGETGCVRDGSLSAGPSGPLAGSAPFAGCPTLTANVIRGSAASNRITATARGDRIFAGPGNDVVNAGAGNDCVDLGRGADIGRGGSGRDLMRGGIGNDRVNGESGDDRIFGDSGNDRLKGGRGRDGISGGSGRDLMRGGIGNDRVNGESGDDRIFGDSGNDRLKGGRGRDGISGGSGRDIIDARDRQRDRISCGRGRDTVLANRFDRVARDCERVNRRR